MSVAAVESYLQLSECGIVAAAALLAFDYCLTLGREVEWVYGTKWTAARIHFFCSRHLPFVAIAMAIPTSRPQPGAPSGTNYCGSLGMATNVVYYLCTVLAEAMLIVRTYAFWKRDRKILIGMCTGGIICMLVAITVSVTVSTQPTDSVYKSLDCLGVEGKLSTAIQYLSLILYEIGVLCLNLIAFRKMKQQHPPGRLITTLYRDGVMYVTAILVFSFINAIVTLVAPIEWSDILNSPQLVMHSILASRIFFNLRETTRQERRASLPITLSELHAPSPGSTFGSSSSGSWGTIGSEFDPVKGIDTTKVIDITRDAIVVRLEGAVHPL